VPLGTKVWQGGILRATRFCIANAAAAPLGVAEIILPLTPEPMLELLKRSDG